MIKLFNEYSGYLDKYYEVIESGKGEFVNDFYNNRGGTKLSNVDIDTISKLNFISYTPYLHNNKEYKKLTSKFKTNFIINNNNNYSLFISKGDDEWYLIGLYFEAFSKTKIGPEFIKCDTIDGVIEALKDIRNILKLRIRDFKK